MVVAMAHVLSFEGDHSLLISVALTVLKEQFASQG
jgi:hypothetical protein